MFGPEHTAVCAPFWLRPGNTVGGGATLTISKLDCGVVVAGLEVKKGDPVTSASAPPLPMEKIETDPGTKRPLLSVVARLAANRNFPAASIFSLNGTTATDSGVMLP